jgi:hypothetical protein
MQTALCGMRMMAEAQKRNNTAKQKKWKEKEIVKRAHTETPQA